KLTSEGAVIQIEGEIVEAQAVGRGVQPGDQFRLAQGAAVGHVREALAEAVEELAQVEGGYCQGAAERWLVLQIAGLEFAKPAQLIGGELEAAPFGNVCCQIRQQLALSAEVEGLALQGLAGGFAAQAQVFELVALQLVVEAQAALQFGARAHDRFVAAKKSVEFERDRLSLADGAGGQLDAFGAQMLAALGILIGDARILDSQAVDVEL